MRRPGFTLIEIVLAIALAGTLMALLTTAIELYLLRVDSSRTRVETAQLARTLLDKMADDIRAVRFAATQTTTTVDESGTTTQSEIVPGIYGTITELRIDRSATWQWQDYVQQAELAEEALATEPLVNQHNFPQTVRYVLGEGKELLAADLASSGVGEQPLATGHAGLYWEQVSTAAWHAQLAETEVPLGTGDVTTAELIAPEVVDIAFGYFDGTEFLQEWDMALQQSLPAAIEIQLTLLREPYEQAATQTSAMREELRGDADNLVVFRRLVALPQIDPAPSVEYSSTSSQAGQQGQGGGAGRGGGGGGGGGGFGR